MPLEVVGRVCPCFVNPDLERTFLERYYHKCFKLHVGLLLGMLFIFGMTLREVKLTGMVRPDRKMLTYKVDFTKAIQSRRLTMGVADGTVEADGEVIYIVKDMKVALSES